jgi:L-glutamine-phosphate cytidylyltransferase
MQTIILAAGKGSRLGRDVPKAMLKIAKDTTILDTQLRNLSTISSIENIVVVVGFKSELITQKYFDLSFIYNDRYDRTNTAASLLLALEKTNEDDILWLNGDVVFDEDILRLIQKNPGHNLVFVKRGSCGAEEVKYSVDRDGAILRISKTVYNGLGEAVGINFIKKQDLPTLIACLTECEPGDFFEKAIELAIERSVRFLPVDIGDDFCIEIDFEEDLNTVKEHFSGHST